MTKQEIGQEIARVKEAIAKTKSSYLRKDLSKYLRKLEKQQKICCYAKE